MMILTKCFCDPPNLSPIGFCGAKVWFLWCKSMVFVVRKYGICSAKVWFLWCKSMVFALQEVGICVAKSRFLWCESMFFVVRKVGICGVKVWCFVGVRVYIAICSQRCCRPSAALSQSVSSCKGPIYRARIYVNTHVMGKGNACAVM